MPKRRQRRSAPKNCYWRDGVLHGRITVGGVERRFSLRTSDEKLARERIKAERERALAIAHFGDQRRTWKQVFAEWTPAIRLNVKPTTAKRYAVSLRQLEAWLLPLYLDEITKAKVAEVIRGRQATGATNATVRRDLVALSSVLDFAEGQGWRDDNPVPKHLKGLKERRDPIVLPELSDVERVIARAPGMFAAMIKLALQEGCRQNELVTLERRQCDKRMGQVTLYKTKGNKARTLALSSASKQLLEGLPVNMASKYAFWHGDGKPYQNVSSRFRVFVKDAAKAARKEGAEFRAFRFHDLRHLFAVTYLKTKRGTIYDLQQHLGHASIKTTELYLDYLTSEEARAVKYGAHAPGTKVGTPHGSEGHAKEIM